MTKSYTSCIYGLCTLHIHFLTLSLTLRHARLLTEHLHSHMTQTDMSKAQHYDYADIDQRKVILN